MMPSASTELLMLCGFAADDATAFVFAVRPDDWGDPKRETLVHRVHEGVAEYVQAIRQPLNDCWWSRHGVVHVTTDNAEVMSFERGNVRTERVCARAESLEAIIGFDGATVDEDVLLACGGTSLFVRSAGRWSEHPLPDHVAELYRLHGRSANEVYLCTDAGLYLWNGQTFAPRESPEDEIADVFVRSATELVAVGDRVHLWSDGAGWTELKSPFKQHSVGLCSVGSSLYIPSRSGIARLIGTDLGKVCATPAGQLVALGDRVVAAGRDRGLIVGSGEQWKRVSLALPAAAEQR